MSVTTLLSIAVPVSTFVLLMAVGLELTAGDFVRVQRQRVLVVAGLLAPLLLLPPIAIGLSRLLQSPPEVAVAVLLVAACPIGSVCNTYCYLARASLALSITLTGLSSLLAGFTIPVAGLALEWILARPFELAVPFSQLAVQLVLLLVVPVTLGMLWRYRAPGSAARVGPVLQRLSIGGMLLVLTLVIADDTAAFASELTTTVPLAIAFVVSSIAAGWFTGTMVAADRRDRFVIASEFGARNVGVATAIAVTILGRVEFARFTAAYAFVELPLMLGTVVLFRVWQKTRIPRAPFRSSDVSEAGPAV
jgi:BASS family bile acid:Na+ symporter